MTRIADILTHAIEVPLEHAVWTAHEKIDKASLILVEVRTDDGLIGIGQIHGAPMKTIRGWVARFGELLRGRDALATTEIWESLFALTSPRPDWLDDTAAPPPLPRGERLQIMAAIGGIDLALWDIKGKAAGMPVWRLLGGSDRPVFAYATGGYRGVGRPADDCVEELAGFVDNGYRAVKLKTCYSDVASDVARIAAVRAAIGPDVLLMLDMNAAFDLATCQRFAHAVEPLAPFWLEEPLHWYLQPADYARLAAATRVPLAHGERARTLHEIRDFLANGSIGFVQFDATRAGGFTEALRVAHHAAQCGVRIAPHHAPELHAHLVAAFPGAGWGVESHGDRLRDPIWSDLYTERAQVRASHVHLTERPGFGCEIDWRYVERHRAP